MRAFELLLESSNVAGLSLPKTVIERAVRMLIADISMSESDVHYHLDIEPDEVRSMGFRKFQRKLREWAEDRVLNAAENAEWLARSGEIPVWRMITAPEDWTPEGRHPGIYWSWDERAADAHWGDFHEHKAKWLMHARVKPKDIDWPTTLTMNANPAYEEEKEIRLKAGSPVNLIWWKQV